MNKWINALSIEIPECSAAAKKIDGIYYQFYSEIFRH